jgi:polyferredoxin
MECVNCTACIDACDTIMDKIGRPRGLIRLASLNGIERGEGLRVTPRLAGYCAILVLLGAGLGTLLLGKKTIDQALLDDLETTLLSADVGMKSTTAILDELTARLKRNQLADSWLSLVR